MPTAVVTGAESGIAHAFAQILLKEVSDLLLLSSKLLTDIRVTKSTPSIATPVTD